LTAPPTPLSLLSALFDPLHYARVIAPVLAPLSEDFAAYVQPRARDVALDLGTGPGTLAALLSPHVARVVGLDSVPDALAIARWFAPEGRFVAGDLHEPPLAYGAFSLVTASLAFNMTLPRHSLPAAARLLARGGRLAIQEWGPEDALSRALGDLLDAHLPDSLPAPLDAYFDWLATDPPLWGRALQDPDDYADWLSDAGLVVEDVREEAPVVLRVPSAHAYLRWWLAWPVRRQAAEALDGGDAAAFTAAALQRLAASSREDGAVEWRPVVLRALARR
jgi:trans-aconitate methyltransferase